MTSRKKNSSQKKEELWSKQNADWRDPAQIATQWLGSDSISSEMLEYRVTGQWWNILEAAKTTLLLTREYEHLVLALTVIKGEPLISYLPLPHPSGLAIDKSKNVVHIASTRNPNMVFDFAPVTSKLERLDIRQQRGGDDIFNKMLAPRRARYYPGCLYIHDLALIGGELHANSVGQNAVVKLSENGSHERVWWPRCIEQRGKPVFEINHLQLNSIAAGDTPDTSFFSASTDKISARRPGHKNFPVDQRGVIFSGATREPVAYGLTRPHSARLYGNKIYVDNSGYGEFSVIDGGKAVPIARLPGWTRGLAFHDGIAFVGSSRVLPRFTQYAPGVDISKSACGVHAVDIKTGTILGSIVWSHGNQIFGIELAPREMTAGFPAQLRNNKRNLKKEREIYYTFA